ncbi:MAG: hypothetical protein D4R68_08735 [Ignavibacteriales bacterium]|nr:MAG: hypothetical protein D4R68_08735 [Ignavibacteriales bacterium]
MSFNELNTVEHFIIHRLTGVNLNNVPAYRQAGLTRHDFRKTEVQQLKDKTKEELKKASEEIEKDTFDIVIGINVTIIDFSYCSVSNLFIITLIICKLSVI